MKRKSTKTKINVFYPVILKVKSPASSLVFKASMAYADVLPLKLRF